MLPPLISKGLVYRNRGAVAPCLQDRDGKDRTHSCCLPSFQKAWYTATAERLNVISPGCKPGWKCQPALDNRGAVEQHVPSLTAFYFETSISRRSPRFARCLEQGSATLRRLKPSLRRIPRFARCLE